MTCDRAHVHSARDKRLDEWPHVLSELIGGVDLGVVS